MKNAWKRALAVLMTLTMVLALFPASAWAAEAEETTQSDAEVSVYAAEAEDENVTIYSTRGEAVAAVREQLKQRATDFTIYVDLVTSGIQLGSGSVWNDLLKEAWQHTGNPTEGDYIRMQCAGYGGADGTSTTLNGRNVVQFKFMMMYFDTLQQEQELDEKIAKVLGELNLKGKDDYTKIHAIYDYICTNVKYDNDGLQNGDDLARTAYKALVKGKAICQGYANLLYRMALEAGVDCRIIEGTHYGEDHGWNIVKIGGVYYNVDVTEDAKFDVNHHGNFLESDSSFSFGHNRFDYYTSDAFVKAYPMTTENYVAVTDISLTPTLKLDVGESQTLTATVAPDDATNQKVTFTSSDPDVASVDATGKVTALKEGTATITATTEVGGLTATCAVDVPHKHTLTHHDAVAGTCKSEGIRAYWTCDGCGALFSDAAGTTSTTLAALKTGKNLSNHTGETELKGKRDATCTEKGYTGDKICADCGVTLTAGHETETVTHKLTHHDEVIATCVKEGMKEYWECSVCKGVFSDAAGTTRTTLDALKTAKDSNNHTGETEFKGKRDATCTEKGYTGDKVCVDCGVTLTTGHETETVAHTLTHHEGVTGTCAKEGMKEYWECSACKGVFSDADGKNPATLEALKTGKDLSNHTGETELKGKRDATCTEKGYTGDKICADCGVTLTAGHETETVTHKLTHHDEVIATCVKEGMKEYWECSACKGVFSDAAGTTSTTLDALKTAKDPTNHTGETKLEGKRDATCTETGYSGDEVCADCGVTLTAGHETQTVAHKLTHHDGVTATCVKEGMKEYWECSACKGVFSDAAGTTSTTLAALKTAKDPSNHIGATKLEGQKDATCTETGYSGDKVCADCGAVLTAGTTVSKRTHELTRHEATAATHSAAGNALYWSCAVCNGLFGDAAGENPITAQETVIPATERTVDAEHWAFDSAGHWHVCTDCGEQVNAAAHTFGDWTVQKAATTESTGVKARACTSCGYREQAEIPVLTSADAGTPSDNQKPESQTKTENQAPTKSERQTAAASRKSPGTADNSMALVGMAVLALAASGALATALVRKKRMK